MDKIEVKSLLSKTTVEDFDFRKNTYIIHKFDSKVDDIGELKNFHNQHNIEG